MTGRLIQKEDRYRKIQTAAGCGKMRTADRYRKIQA